jgi:hypothetical protein
MEAQQDRGREAADEGRRHQLPRIAALATLAPGP